MKWDSYTKLMLHMNGADASTTFTDEIGKTATVYGNTQIDTAQSKFGDASALFDGTDEGLSFPDSADWNFGTGNFTIDFWLRCNALPADGDYYQICQSHGTNGYYVYQFKRTGANCFLNVYNQPTPAEYSVTSSSSLFSTNTWYHIALVRNGNNWTFYKDGTALNTVSQSNGVGDFDGLFYIGRSSGGVKCINGWVDELRISKGIARWTADFTPPTEAYAPDVPSGARNRAIIIA